MIPPSSLVISFRDGTHIAPSCDLRGCMALSIRSPFSPAQPWARQDTPLSQGRWRDALFEVPFRQRLERNELRSQVTIEPCGLPRWIRGVIWVPYHLLLTSSPCRNRIARGQSCRSSTSRLTPALDAYIDRSL